MVGAGAELPLALLPFPVFGELARFDAATTTRAFGGAGGGGLATAFTLMATSTPFFAGLATAASGFLATFAAAMTGVFTAFGATAFAAGRMTDFGGATGGIMVAGLRALLDGAFAVATAVLLVFVAVVLSDFFVVNL